MTKVARHRRARICVAVAAVTVSAAAVAGCGAGPGSTLGAATASDLLPEPGLSSTMSTPEPTSSQAVTTAVAVRSVGPSTSFVAPITDKDGYQFDIAVKLTTSNLGGTVEFDKPGFMSSLFTVSLSMQLINKTPGRAVKFESVSGVTAPLSNPKFLLSAVWDAGSVVCKAASISKSSCGIIIGFGYATTPLAPSSTITLETKKGHPSGWFTAGLAGFPESAWPQLKTALAAPERFLISYDGGGYKRFACELNDRVGVIVASSNAGFDCKHVAIEMVKQPAS